MHRLGDVVDVRLVEAAPVAGALRFELLSEGQRCAARTQARTARSATRRPAKRNGASGPQPAQEGSQARQEARPANRRRASHQRKTMEAHRTKVWTRGTGARRKARRLDRDEARLSRPLPALRRRQTVSRLPEGRRSLLGMRTGFHAAPRRRSAGLSRHRHRRPHRGAGRAVDRDQLFAGGLRCSLRSICRSP